MEIFRGILLGRGMGKKLFLNLICGVNLSKLWRFVKNVKILKVGEEKGREVKRSEE